MANLALEETISSLPSALRNDRFRVLQRGVYDSEETDVYVNEENDFAFLCPRPAVDYVRYKPRVETLKLRDYKQTLEVVQRRFEKIERFFVDVRSVLEIGAGDGAFLAYVGSRTPGVALASQEVDENTRPDRDAIADLTQYGSFEEVRASRERFDRVCLFHVLEHVFEPETFLRAAAAVLTSQGRLVIEVPSLRDPLISLYDCEAYRRFYFQRQHPYVYSPASLGRLLSESGFEVECSIAHQRYGLENHLHWLAAGEPGGSKSLREILRSCEADYLTALERASYADSVIAVARPSPD